MGDDFLAQRHAEFNTSERMLFDLINQATGLKPMSRRKIIDGYDNEVYLVQTATKDVIVRIRRHGEVGFREESWAIEACLNAGVAVPMIWTVEEIHAGDSTLEMMIQSVVPGRSLREWIGILPTHEVVPLLERAGSELAKIHSIAVQGFYQYHASGVWDFSAWDQICDSAIKDRANEESYIREAGFSSMEFAFMMGILREYPHRFPCDHPVLCHGDFLPSHIFFDDNHQLTGVIDFGQFQGGPDIHDFALFSLNRPDHELFTMIDGYPGRSYHDPEFLHRLHMHRMTLAMGFLAHEMRIGDRKSTAVTSSKLRQSLEWLRSR